MAPSLFRYATFDVDVSTLWKADLRCSNGWEVRCCVFWIFFFWLGFNFVFNLVMSCVLVPAGFPLSYHDGFGWRKHWIWLAGKQAHSRLFPPKTVIMFSGLALRSFILFVGGGLELCAASFVRFLISLNAPP